MTYYQRGGLKCNTNQFPEKSNICGIHVDLLDQHFNIDLQSKGQGVKFCFNGMHLGSQSADLQKEQIWMGVRFALGGWGGRVA